jgi:hypothetical protein
MRRLSEEVKQGGEAGCVGLAVLVSAGAEMRRSGLDGCTQPHHTKATERKQRKVHKPGKLRRRRRFASSVASTAVWKLESDVV